MMSSVRVQNVTTELFYELYQQKSHDREVLKCPKCRSRLEALPLEIDKHGNQRLWWICKNARKETCDFPIDMPPEVFWVVRTPQQRADGYVPRPDIRALPIKYRSLYPGLFGRNGQRDLFPARSVDSSRCSSRNSNRTNSGAASLSTYDISLASQLPSPAPSGAPQSPNISDIFDVESSRFVTTDKSVSSLGKPSSTATENETNTNVDETQNSYAASFGVGSNSETDSSGAAPLGVDGQVDSSFTAGCSTVSDDCLDEPTSSSTLQSTSTVPLVVTNNKDGHMNEAELLRRLSRNSAKETTKTKTLKRTQPTSINDRILENMIHAELNYANLDHIDDEKLSDLVNKAILKITSNPNKSKYLKDGAVHESVLRNEFKRNLLSRATTRQLKERLSHDDVQNKLPLHFDMRNAVTGDRMMFVVGADESPPKILRSAAIDDEIAMELRKKNTYDRIASVVSHLTQKRQSWRMADGRHVADYTAKPLCSNPVENTIRLMNSAKPKEVPITPECEHKTKALIKNKINARIAARQQAKKEEEQAQSLSQHPVAEDSQMTYWPTAEENEQTNIRQRMDSISSTFASMDHMRLDIPTELFEQGTFDELECLSNGGELGSMNWEGTPTQNNDMSIYSDHNQPNYSGLPLAVFPTTEEDDELDRRFHLGAHDDDPLAADLGFDEL